MALQWVSTDPCPLCFDRGAMILFEAKDHQNKVPGLFRVAQCRRCRFIFLDPMPEGRKIEEYYAVDDLYPYGPVQRSSLREFKNKLLSYCTKIYSQSSKKMFHRIAAVLFRPVKKKLIPIPPSGNKILDIGCGNGSFLLNLKEMGWNVYGCELSKSGAAVARQNGLQVFQGTVFDARYPNAFFDVVRLEQVFEHIHDPDSLLKEIRRILKPSGLLVIGVPHGQSLSFQIFGQYWGLLGVPFHLFQYSAATLQKVLSRNGFQVLEFRYFPALQCWLWSINNFLNEKFKTGSEEGFLGNRLFIRACRFIVFPMVRLLYLFHPSWADMIQVFSKSDASAQAFSPVSHPAD